MQFTTGYGPFFQMCDTMQGVRQVDTTGNATNVAVPNATVAGPEGVGLDKALPNFAAWFKIEYLPDCKCLCDSGRSNIAGERESVLADDLGFLACASFGAPEWSDRMNVQCFDTYNSSSPLYTDRSPLSAINQELGLQWLWMQCNQPMAWFKT